MKPAEFIIELSKRLQLPKTEVARRLDDTVAVIAAELVKNNVVSVPNFGSFEVAKRNEKINVNPLNGKKMLIPPKLVVKFKVSPTLKDKIKDINHE
jgi:nucleoid DNA-binding protein